MNTNELISPQPEVPDALSAAMDRLAEQLAPKVERYFKAMAERAALFSKNVFNTDEAAAYLGCSKGWLYELSSTGQLACSKVGSKLFYARADLDAFALQNRTRSEEELQREARRIADRVLKGGRARR